MIGSTISNYKILEKAIDIIERLLSIPAEFSATYARVDPKWKPLQGNNRFEELVK